MKKINLHIRCLYILQQYGNEVGVHKVTIFNVFNNFMEPAEQADNSTSLTER